MSTPVMEPQPNPEIAANRKKDYASRLAFASCAQARTTQHRVFAQLCERLQAEVQVGEMVDKYLKQREKLEKKFSKSLADLSTSFINDKPVASTGAVSPLEAAFHTVLQAQQSEANSRQVLSNSIHSHSRKLLKEQSKEAQKQLDAFQSTQDKSASFQEDLFEMAESQLRTWERLARDVAAGQTPTEDPWLVQVKFSETLRTLQMELDQNNEQLKKACEQVSVSGRARGDLIRQALHDVVDMTQSLMVGTTAKDLAKAAAQLDSTSTQTTDYEAWAVRAGLIKPAEQPSTQVQAGAPAIQAAPESLNEPTGPADVLRMDKLELSGVLRWKPYTFVLTRFGYLHWFDKETLHEPAGSIELRHTTIEIADDAKSFTLHFDPPGMFNLAHNYTLRAVGGEGSVTTWLTDLQKFAKSSNE